MKVKNGQVMLQQGWGQYSTGKEKKKLPQKLSKQTFCLFPCFTEILYFIGKLISS